MSVYTIEKCERFVSQRAGCGKAARPEFCERCTTVGGAPTRHLKEKGSVSKKTINKPGVKAPYAALKIAYLSVVSSRQRIIIRLKYIFVKSLFG